MKLPVLEDLPDVGGRRVLVRCDFNVPLKDGRITDDQRIRAAVPTLAWLVERGAQVNACSHLGRPHGTIDRRFDIAPVRARLRELVPGVELLDNLRFDPGEEANDPGFVDRLIADQEFYVNDAFGSAHRSHASVVGPPSRLPSAAGRLMVREVEVLSRLRESPARPFVALLGGAKVADKLGVVSALLDRVDAVAIGGGMCFTFLSAAGHQIGDSLVDNGRVDRCRQLLGTNRIHLPSDLVVARSSDPSQVTQVGPDVSPGWKGLDIGPRSSSSFADTIRSAATVLWSGPMGMFEDPRFAAGTQAVANAIADTSAFTVVGGGDTIAAVAKFGFSKRIDHISTGGGATLEFVEHGDLPGLKALRDAGKRMPSSWRPGSELAGIPAR